MNTLEQASSSKYFVSEGLCLSKLLWNLDWEKHLPKKISSEASEIILKQASTKDCFFYITQNSEEFFNSSESTLLIEKFADDRKERFFKRISDGFLIYSKDKAIGVLLTEISDWSTYYIRFVALNKEFRSKGIYSKILDFMLEILGAHQVSRLEIDVTPVNIKHQGILLRKKFVPIGNILSERFGSVIRYAFFMDEKADMAFRETFCPRDVH